MHTAHTDCTEPIRFTYKQMQRRDMLFRYANRHDFIARPSDCSPREPSFFFYPLAALPCHGSLFFCCLYTKPSRVVAVPLRQRRLRRRWRRRRLLLLQYSGSRKSQINPFVIPHRSFQSVRISSTRFYATSAPSQNSSPFLFRLPAVLLKRRELLFVSISLSLFSFFSTYFTLPYFRHFFLLFLCPFILVASSLSRLLACARNYFFF